MTLDVVLNRHLASWMVMHRKLFQYYFHVTRPGGYYLHRKFEQMYFDAEQIIFELAEHLIAIGDRPMLTLEQALRLTMIDEATGVESNQQMANQILSDLELLVNDLRQCIQSTLSSNVAIDLLASIARDLDRHSWSLHACAVKDLEQA